MEKKWEQNITNLNYLPHASNYGNSLGVAFWYVRNNNINRCSLLGDGITGCQNNFIPPIPRKAQTL